MGDWKAVEPDWDAALAQFENPIQALADGEVPAFIFRQAFSPDHCAGLTRRFINLGVMRDARTSPANLDRRTRIDIGTSLGNRASDKERFLEHAEATHFLFNFLFQGFVNPVDLIYDSLQKLAPKNDVKVAREPDGRLYSPAIFRVHYDGHTYKPHIDHVVLRENRVDYEVYRFKHQFAGVLCVQNADASGPGTQAILHKCLWSEDIQPYIAEDTFHDYAQENNIENCQVDLVPGDLYFFNTPGIHEVPAVQGDLPRIVLAVSIGYSEEDDEIYVWS